MVPARLGAMQKKLGTIGRVERFYDLAISFCVEARRCAVATIIFFAPAERQWTLREVNLLNALRRTLGNESRFGWCDVVTSSAGDGPRAEFCDHFGCVVRLTRSSRRYEITCMRTDVCSRTTKLERALEFVRVRWNLRAHTDLDRPLHRHAG